MHSVTVSLLQMYAPLNLPQPCNKQIPLQLPVMKENLLFHLNHTISISKMEKLALAGFCTCLAQILVKEKIIAKPPRTQMGSIWRSSASPDSLKVYIFACFWLSLPKSISVLLALYIAELIMTFSWHVSSCVSLWSNFVIDL